MKRLETQTVTIEREAERCESSEDLVALLSLAGMEGAGWKEYMNRLLDESGLSYIAFAARCGISKNTLKKWCVSGSVPRSRNTFIKIGFGAGMDASRVSFMLTRYGGYHGLYPKDLFDAACMYALKKRAEGDERYDFPFVWDLYRRCLPGERETPVDSAETEAVRHRLLAIDAEADFLRFARENHFPPADKRPRLLAFLQDFIDIRLKELSREDGRPASLHRLAERLRFPPDFEKTLSVLRTQGILPRRDRLISFGLHLNMTLSELNRMLEFAGMERLYAKDRMECVLIYALQRLCLLNPELPLSNAMQLMQVTRSPAVRRQCEALVEEYMEKCYKSADEEWDSVTDYIRKVLRDLDLDEAEELRRLL